MRDKIKILFFNSRKYDFVTSGLIEGLNDMRDTVELCTTNPGSYADPAGILPLKEAVVYGETEADFLVLGSNHYVDHDTFWKIRPKKAKRVYIDGWDTGQLCLLNKTLSRILKFHRVFKTNLYLQENSLENYFRIIFKKDYSLWSTLRGHALLPFPAFHAMRNKTSAIDLLQNAFYGFLQNRVAPLPFGVEKRCQLDFNPHPEYMLSCMLTPDRVTERQKIIDFLREKQRPGMFIGKIEHEDEAFRRMEEIGACDPQVPQDQRGYAFHNEGYYRQIQNSRACVSVPGGGFETFRFWEILGAGSLLISKRVALRMPNPLVENKHYLAFDTIEELNECIRRLYESPEEMDRIRREGYEYARRHHTTRRRAEYFIDTITEPRRF